MSLSYKYVGTVYDTESIPYFLISVNDHTISESKLSTMKYNISNLEITSPATNGNVNLNVIFSLEKDDIVNIKYNLDEYQLNIVISNGVFSITRLQ